MILTNRQKGDVESSPMTATSLISFLSINASFSTNPNALTLMYTVHRGPPYLDHDTAAAHHLAGFALTVDLAETDPLPELLVIVNLNESGES